MRFWKLLFPLLASSLCFAAQPDRILSPVSSSQMVALPGNVHPQAQPQYDQGPVESTLPFGYVTLVIAPSAAQQAALTQLLAQQQDRRSANFHKWLTPEQYAERFGLSVSDINKITAWLQSQGFAIVRTARGRNSVTFSGTAEQIQSSFKTEIHRYLVNGENHIANATPISLPAALAGVVTTVRGLHDFRPKPMYVRPALGGKPGPHPSFTTTIQNNTDYFIAPGDIATLYDINPLYDATPAIDGTGQKLAIMGQTDIYFADLNDFRSGFSLPTYTCTTATNGLITSCNTTNFKYILLGTDPGSPSLGDLFEADLDVEWSGAVARNAQIIFVNAETSGGVNDALSYAIDNSTAPVLSMSYGACEREAGTLETELQQANSQGITIMNSSGDTGAANCDYNPPNNTPPYQAADGGLAVSYPASSPEVTGVGGTAIPSTDFNSTYWSSTNGANGASALSTLIGQEVAWNDDEALGEFCASNPTNSFCKPSPGVAVTNAQTFQEDYWISIGGGGVSNCYNPSQAALCSAGFARPTWQSAITIPGLTSPQSTYRFVPDVSLLASPNFPGYILCTPVEELSSTAPYKTETTSSCASGVNAAADGVVSGNNFVVEPSIVGGTSASAPVFAGIVTLINQYVGGAGQGNINPTLYSLAADSSSASFHSVKIGDNNVYCQSGTPAGQPADVICPSAGVFGFDATNADTTTGYNLVTGLGSVDANVLATAWKALLQPDFALSAGTLSPSSVSAGNSTSTILTLTPVAGSTAMVVNFSSSSCSGLPTGATCSFNPQTVSFDGTDPITTTLTISTTPTMASSGPSTITITPTNSPGTSTTVSLTVSLTTDSFTLTSTAATFSVAVGGTASVPITVNSSTGFINTSNNTTAVPVTYSCSGIPATAEISCQFSPSNGQAVSATSVTLSLVTTPVTTELRPIHDHGSRIFYAMLLPGLFGIFFAGGSRTRGARLLGLIVVLSCSTLWLGACGGSSNNNTSLQNPGTPAGQYPLTVNATTGGANPITSSLAITLTVTQ